MLIENVINNIEALEAIMALQGFCIDTNFLCIRKRVATSWKELIVNGKMRESGRQREMEYG